MMTVAKLIEELKKFPPDALCYAYEGEITGVVIKGQDVITFPNGGRGRPQLGYVPASENDVEDGPAVDER